MTKTKIYIYFYNNTYMENIENFIKIIIQTQNRLTQNLPKTKRYFYFEIEKNLKQKPPMILMVHGFRGIGKTISLLQNLNENAIYFRADSLGFKTKTITEIVQYLYINQNKRIFLIDEIQKYQNWEEEIKGLYDDFPDIKLVLSGSSASIIKTKSADLSRRLKKIHAKPLFFNEFIEFKTGKKVSTFNIEDIIKDPLSTSIKAEQETPNIYYLFKEYILFGGFPIYFRETDIIPLIENSIKRVIYFDIPNIIENSSVKTLKKLENIIMFLALSSPGDFSYDSVASISELSKGTIYELISVLKDADLIDFLMVDSKKSSVRLRKKFKIYFTHPTLRHALLKSAGEQENIGYYREEFFHHHIKSLGKVGYLKKEGAKEPDFILKRKNKEYLFEIGKHKDKKGFINVYDSSKAKYPLYLFGLIKQN